MFNQRPSHTQDGSALVKRRKAARSFRLLGSPTAISCMQAPWESSRSRTHGEDVFDIAERQAGFRSWAGVNRTEIWGLGQLAVSGLVDVETLFRRQGPGKVFVLRPARRSPIPLQWTHTGPGTIPDALADMPCKGVAHALLQVNDIMGTDFALEDTRIRGLLEYAVGESRDFGELYGRVRPWWAENPKLSQPPAEILASQKWRDAEFRAISHGNHFISNASIPPRRIWDLYSNRVLPYHALLHDHAFDEKQSFYDKKFQKKYFVHADLSTVSHSWVAEADRVDVWTSINGQEWPVPLPRKTTLEHVRVELLNMGAEYVWLDVLCLRQKGPSNEALRLKEWEVDVPTIGFIYKGRPARRCITYFNGLGLPLTTDPAVLDSTQHWLNRVWTLQESLEGWLPGGLTPAPLADAQAFFARVSGLIACAAAWDDPRARVGFVQDLKRRRCTKELDRIAGLAYYFGCETLPVYNEGLALETAWALLLKHAEALSRTQVFLQYPADMPFAPFVSFAGFQARNPVLPLAWLYTTEGPVLVPADQTQLGGNGPAHFAHFVRCISQHYILARQRGDAEGTTSLFLEVHDAAGDLVFTLQRCAVHGVLLPDVPYTIVCMDFAENHWVVGEVLGETEVQGQPAVQVAKWAVIYIASGEGERLMHIHGDDVETWVVYAHANEAKKQSRYAEQYLEAFKEMQKCGRIYTFGDQYMYP
ncbi:hypothetical protein PsYK624_114050 [Phanerochaete sordida]|uniref:Heterokaryon incompatibility domain-containing protein n=1 Tax=Phanerochaete sordida TaxID=48140 RepID=A0A9P3GKM6_9APHY|nr:hypothetical protein PsYK624_114050 [Phanerochaete sordida]